MAIIINFPHTAPAPRTQTLNVLISRFMSMIIRIVWVLVAITWPALRWILAFDVTIHFFRMLVFFAEKGIYVDWIFIVHFSCLVVLTYFVTVYKPRIQIWLLNLTESSILIHT